MLSQVTNVSFPPQTNGSLILVPQITWQIIIKSSLVFGPVTIADESTYTIEGFGTVKPTSSITLSFVLRLPSLAPLIWSPWVNSPKTYIALSHFFLIIVFFRILWRSKILVKDMFLMVSTFLTHRCLNQLFARVLSLHLKHIVGWDILLYLFLKKLCPRFHVPLIDCESCHFTKHHRSSLSPRINKRVDFVFDLVHSDVWGPCHVVSEVGFRYCYFCGWFFPNDMNLFYEEPLWGVFSFSTFCAEIKT